MPAARSIATHMSLSTAGGHPPAAMPFNSFASSTPFVDADRIYVNWSTGTTIQALALDLRWTWSHEADHLWRALDRDTWEATANPWLLLQALPRERLVAQVPLEAIHTGTHPAGDRGARRWPHRLCLS